jgi:beta-galactosidase/beta-glucuronidase
MSSASALYSHSKYDSRRLSGHWQAQPVPLDSAYCPQALTDDWIDVPECAHLQPVLYPDNPFWGDRLRAINQQAWVYRRTFKRAAGDYRRARLHFEGVDYFAEVWVNDQLAGRHEGHFAPFDVDITPFLNTEAVTLTIRVSAPWDAPNPKGTYPSNHVIRGLVKGLYEHGEGVIPPAVNPLGIWRPVWLLLDQGVSIDHVRVQTDLSGRVNLRFRIANHTGDRWRGSLDLRIQAENHDGPGASVRQALDLPPGHHVIDHILPVPEPHLWWSWDQGSPDLYGLQALLLDGDEQVVGAKQQRFGIRTVRLERTPERFTYWLNERPVFLRGTSYMPALYLSQCNAAVLEGDLALARAANLNLLRVHVHVSPPELYELCDAAGMLVWQDFELNWVQDTSAQFEQRAIAMQRDMIDLLGSHPSIITWACHNEPTMVITRRHNLEQRPDPALYADACQQDPTRPVFICSGQIEDDWLRSGDAHSYYGAIWSSHYTDIYQHKPLLNTEFGFEAPAALDTLRAYPDVWQRLQHLEGQVEELWDYQAALIQYHVEHFRRLRPLGCAGYVHFWLVDLVPQVGCGVLDVRRSPKGGYEALRRASLALQVSLEHNGRRPIALWVFNDTPQAYPGAMIHWQIEDGAGELLLVGETRFDIAANASQRVTHARWLVAPAACARVTLQIYGKDGELLCENEYEHPFQPLNRPRGYPWKFDPYLGTKVFNREDAPSLADTSSSGLARLIPLGLREALAERMLRQRLPSRVVSRIARLVDAVLG